MEELKVEEKELTPEDYLKMLEEKSEKLSKQYPTKKFEGTRFTDIGSSSKSLIKRNESDSIIYRVRPFRMDRRKDDDNNFSEQYRFGNFPEKLSF